MKIAYTPHRLGNPSSLTVKKYEKSLEAIEIYIENLIVSHANLLNQVDINEAEYALTHGLINDFDVSHGNDIEITSNIKMYLVSYVEGLIKSSYQMGVSSGDNKGTAWALNETKKLESKRNQKKRSRPNCETEKIRSDIYYLIEQDFNAFGKSIKDYKHSRYVDKYKKYLEGKGTYPAITDQTITRHIRIIKEIILQENDK